MLATEAKKIFAKPRLRLGQPESRARGAAEASDGASAKGWTLVMEWVSVWRLALPLQLASPWPWQ